MATDAAPANATGGDASVLADLASKISSVGDEIKALKSASEPDKAAIDRAVSELLDAKREYASLNGGIGVDGKKFEEPLTKAQKKAKAKAEKAAKGGGGGGKDVANAENAAKKAAKKAEAKAKKAAIKAQKAAGGSAGAATAGSEGDAIAVAAGGLKPPKPMFKGPAGPPGHYKPKSAGAGSARPAKVASSKSKLQPMQLSFSPNAPLTERPVVSLTVAILTDTVLDYELASDHTRHGPGLGLPRGGEIGGDLAIARFVARRSLTTAKNFAASKLLGETDEAMGHIDQWIDYALTVSRFGEERARKAIGLTLAGALVHSTYVAGHDLTLADVALFMALGFPSQYPDLDAVCKSVPPAAERWVRTVASHPAVREATQLAVGIAGNAEACFDAGLPLEPLVPGMNPLQGATPGAVVTRFPPEPSGYLHVGHAKAVLLNDYYARRYNGRLIVRFDDTNPTKEKEEYQQSILEDLGKLGVKPDVVTFTSDYFRTIRGYAEYMITEGLAFMDDTPQEEMQKQRMDRVNSKHRDQTPAECMEKFELMCSGKPEGAPWCLRARIDMTSVNGTMRDPVLYRQNTTPHHRSGSTYKAYPTYDLACPIVDSVEGVTHALRTTEYNDRDVQYQWIQNALNLRRVRIHSFARMDFKYTELSKRKLTWFVENEYVTGWDDARMPTVRGVVRRGIDVAALRNFICSQGASRRIVNMEWNKFWAENKSEIDAYSKRYMAIDSENHVVLKITNGPQDETMEYVTTDCHPKDPSLGKRVVRIASEVLLEAVDADGLTVGEDIVLMRWGVVKITKTEGGLEGTYVPDGDVKAAKRKLSWIASVPQNTPCILTEFDNLVTKEKLEEGDNFKDFVNPDTLAESMAIGDAGLKTLQTNDIIQLERRGYYRVDRPYIGEGKPLVLYMIPDGKAKPMSGLAGKLAHR